MAKTKTWTLFDHFCSILVEKCEKVLSHKAFDNIQIAKLHVVHELFKQFEQFTLSNKRFKGFPTTKGFKVISSLPKSTTMPKSNEKIVEMFATYFDSQLDQILLLLEKEQQLSKARLLEPQHAIKISDDDDDDNDQDEDDMEDNSQEVPVVLPKVKQEHKEENKSVTQTSPSTKKSNKSEHDIEEGKLIIQVEQHFKEDRSNIRSNEQDLKRKAEDNFQHEAKHKKVDDAQSKRLNKGVITKLKKDMKIAIGIDTEQKDKDMKHTKEVLALVQSLIQEYSPIYEKQVRELQQRKESLLKEISALEQELETNCNVYLKQLIDFNESSTDFIKEKEEEFAVLALKEEEELDDFFASVYKKKQ